MVNLQNNWQHRSYFEGFCLGSAVAAAEYLLSYDLANGSLSLRTLGFVSSWPPGLAALIACVLPFLMKRANPRVIMLWALTTQVFGLSAMAYAFSEHPFNLPAMFIGLVAYWCGSQSCSASSVDWFALLLPAEKVGRFFATRQRWIYFATLLTYLIFGLGFSERSVSGLVSGALWCAAALRLVSVGVTALLPPPQLPEPAVRIRGLTPPKWWLPVVALALTSFLFRAAAGFSLPFYSSFMLHELQVTHRAYVLLTALPLAIRILFLSRWTLLLERNGHWEGLALGFLIIGITPFAWALHPNVWSLVGLQALSAIGWSGYDLLALLLIQRLIPAERSLVALSCFVSAGAMGQMVGAFGGTMWLEQTGSYASLFAWSGVGRLLTAALMLGVMRKCHMFRFRKLCVARQAGLLLFPRWAQENKSKAA